MGNSRVILVSDQAGRLILLDRLEKLKIKYDEAKLKDFITEVKELEKNGWAFDGADASFELLARKTFGKVPEFFNLFNYRVLAERRVNAKKELVTVSEATVKMIIKAKKLVRWVMVLAYKCAGSGAACCSKNISASAGN